MHANMEEVTQWYIMSSCYRHKLMVTKVIIIIVTRNSSVRQSAVHVHSTCPQSYGTPPGRGRRAGDLENVVPTYIEGMQSYNHVQ